MQRGRRLYPQHVASAALQLRGERSLAVIVSQDDFDTSEDV